MKEIWKDIEGYEGLYQVSNFGRVKRLSRYVLFRSVFKLRDEIILKQQISNTGYVRVALLKEGKRTNTSVHRLVATAFLPNPENKPIVDHINTIRNDNCVENLRWATHNENANNPLTIKAHSESQKYGVSHFNRDTYGESPIMRISQDGDITEYSSIADAVREGFSAKKIQRCCQGKRILYLGYDWRYKDKDEKPPINISEALPECLDFKRIVRRKNGETKVYIQITDVIKDGFDPSTVNKCIKGIRKHHKGYEWYVTNEF